MRPNKKGITAALVMVALSIITITAGASLYMVQSQYGIIRREGDYIKASSLADAGIKYAAHLIRSGTTSYNTDWTLSGQAIHIEIAQDGSDFNITSSYPAVNPACKIVAKANSAARITAYRETR